jgi:L-ascorbate metabolism protein UlaG (beta-lactamase superfamily)
MIEPFLKDDEFLADVAAAQGQADELHVWWLGQSGFLVQGRGRHLLMDPYLSDSLTEKYAKTDKPHVRMTGRVVDPANLASFVDVITSSHNHTDHLDAQTLAPILAARPGVDLLAPEANRGFVAQRLKIDVSRVTGIDDGDEVDLRGFTFKGVAAAHEKIERDDKGRCVYLGYVVRLGPWTIYHSGDCVIYDGLAERLAPYRVDVALLPINGSAPERRVAGNMSGAEAARLAHDIGARMVIPCHYDMFAFNTASPDEFVRACKTLGQPYTVLRAGERFSGGSREAR